MYALQQSISQTTWLKVTRLLGHYTYWTITRLLDHTYTILYCTSIGAVHPLEHYTPFGALHTYWTVTRLLDHIYIIYIAHLLEQFTLWSITHPLEHYTPIGALHTYWSITHPLEHYTPIGALHTYWTRYHWPMPIGPLTAETELLTWSIFRVGQNHIYTVYIRYFCGIFGREITKYTVIYGVYIRFWPTLSILLLGQSLCCLQVSLHLQRVPHSVRSQIACWFLQLLACLVFSYIFYFSMAQELQGVAVLQFWGPPVSHLLALAVHTSTKHYTIRNLSSQTLEQSMRPTQLREHLALSPLCTSRKPHIHVTRVKSVETLTILHTHTHTRKESQEHWATHHPTHTLTHTQN
jgi:hypothetical protein